MQLSMIHKEYCRVNINSRLHHYSKNKDKCQDIYWRVSREIQLIVNKKRKL